MKALVVGSGSIGRRHLRNLHALGVVSLAVCDCDPKRLQPMVDELGVHPFQDYSEALTTIAPDMVFICTPPTMHVEFAAQAVERNAHVFIEKPLSHSVTGVDDLIARARARQRVVQVGYNLRFHPGLQKVKELVDSGTVGRVVWLRSEAGQYLPDWRPWQDYRESYTARHALGGGIILDGSHELDYVLWMLGEPTEVVCMAGKVSDLNVDVEDCATILLRYPNGAQADVHMDFVQRCYSRSCRVAGTDGTISWDYVSNHVQLCRASTSGWETFPYTFEANDMYVAELRHFLECIERGESPIVDLEQGKRVLKVVLAAKRSVAERRMEAVA